MIYLHDDMIVYIEIIKEFYKQIIKVNNSFASLLDTKLINIQNQFYFYIPATNRKIKF